MRAIIVFGSFVGNTETMARYVARGLSAGGIDADCRDVINVAAPKITAYDLILLGSPTYEPKMIQDDMLPFYAQLQGVDLSGKPAAAFGPGDSAWPDFCTAVEMLEARLVERGARIVAPAFTIDGIVEEHEAATVNWGERVARAARGAAAGEAPAA